MGESCRFAHFLFDLIVFFPYIKRKTRMKVLVFGANGQLGKCIQDIEGIKFLGTSPYGDFRFYDKDSGDIKNALAIEKLVKEEKPDFIINCAAYTQVEAAETNSECSNNAYEINTMGPMNLAIICKQYGVKLVHISTDYVFDGQKGFYTEDDKPNPINIYGRSKLFGERAIMRIMTPGTYYIIRTSWLYSKYNNNFFGKITSSLLSGEKVYVVEDQIGCPTYAPDLAKFIVDIVENKGHSDGGIYHFTNLGIASRYDVAKEIERTLGLSDMVVPISSKESENTVHRPPLCIMSKTKALAEFGPIRQWADALREYVETIPTQNTVK